MRGVIIIIFFSILLIISGCQTGTTTGFSGVNMRFIENYPPTTVRDNGDFRIGLVLTNSMPRQVDDAKVCVYDLALDSAGGIPKVQCSNVLLPAAEEDNNRLVPSETKIFFPEGGGTYVYHAGEQGIDGTTILTEMTYTADSSVQVKNVCFRKDFDMGDDPSCKSDEVFSAADIDSDAAPVTITKIEKSIYQSGAEAKIELVLYMSKGSGEVISSDDETKNLMEIEISSGEANYFVCTPSENGLIEFNSNNEKITCVASVPLSEDIYTDSLNINMYYKYKVKLSIPITIKKEGSTA